MNLIEQLGSYDKAKNWLDKNEIHVKHGYLERYRKELLQHRRENNIYEVGDLIVLPYTNYRSDVFELTKLLKETYDDKGVAYRHATPEEIKAGRRL